LEYTQITALEGCCVKDINFCSAGLAVWYSQIDEGGLFRIYNPHTGACMDEEFLPDHTRVLMCGYLGCADALISPTEIKLHTYGISKQELAQQVNYFSNI